MKNRVEVKQNRHWLFWPLLFLIFFFLVHVYFFSGNGYFAYLNVLEYKEKIEQQNKQLEKEKEMLTNKLKKLKKDSDALEELSPMYLLYKDEVSIIKFYEQDDDDNPIREKEHSYDILYLQRVFVASVSLLMIIITFGFWKWQHRQIQKEEDEKLASLEKISK